MSEKNLENIYKNYSKEKEMNSRQFLLFNKEYNLLDNKYKKGNIDIIFTKLKLSNTLTFDNFINSIKEIARVKEISYEELKNKIIKYSSEIKNNISKEEQKPKEKKNKIEQKKEKRRKRTKKTNYLERQEKLRQNTESKNLKVENEKKRNFRRKKIYFYRRSNKR